MSLSAAPAGTDIDGVREFLLNQPGVVEIHDLHVQPHQHDDTAMTCHLMMLAGPGDDFS